MEIDPFIFRLSIFILSIFVGYFINEKFDKVNEKHRRAWVIGQWCTTGFLWYTWLSHDVANIAVFLPRQLPINLLIVCIVLLSVLLFYIFWDRGGRIQKIELVHTLTTDHGDQGCRSSGCVWSLLDA